MATAIAGRANCPAEKLRRTGGRAYTLATRLGLVRVALQRLLDLFARVGDQVHEAPVALVPGDVGQTQLTVDR